MTGLRVTLLLVAAPVLLVACASGAPPPGPIDVVREICDSRLLRVG